MKTALFLSIVCAASLIAGCSTERGGTADTYESTSGTVTQSGPAVTDPSLPPPAPPGPAMTDPSLPQTWDVGPQIIPP